MKIKKIIATYLVSFVFLIQTGCLVVAAVGAGAGIVAYTKGAQRARYTVGNFPLQKFARTEGT